MSRRRSLPLPLPLALALLAALAAAPRPAAAPTETVLAIPLGPNALAPCAGAAITPTRVVTGQFPTALMGAYVMLPIEVPAGTTQLRVKSCYEGGGHTVDLGLWSARDGDAPWGPAQFRGWGGSSHPDVAISAQGFSSEAQYRANPRGYVPGRTTRGFVPGSLPAGTWAAELGVAAVVSLEEGDEDGLTDWRVEIELASDPAFDDEPYVPAPYDETPANASPGWYVGDLHVHAEHSALGDATMTETFDYAFRPLAQGGAGLDFVALSDYVTTTGWSEIGRYQAAHPGKLVMRSAEIITYRGHAMNHGSLRYVDHRTGPVYELSTDGGLTLLRTARAPGEVFAEIRAAGGATQVNHPTTCPSDSAFCRRTCRGCPWDYTELQTEYAALDAIEVHNGPPFSYALFTPQAIAFWEAALADGHDIAAVAVSDSHQAGRAPDATQSPIGRGATVVYAEELSERGLLDAIRAGHTYAKPFGSDGPDLRFAAEGDAGTTGILGDTLAEEAATLRAEVLNLRAGEPVHRLRLLRDGVEIAAESVSSPGGVFTFRAEGLGRYRLQLEKDVPTPGLVQALTTPITLAGAPAPDGDGDGIADDADNCSAAANADQRDTDADGYGNRCDADLTQDGVVGPADFEALRASFGRREGAAGYDPDADLTGDGVVGLPDVNALRAAQGRPPGPSGLACAGTIPCPAP